MHNKNIFFFIKDLKLLKILFCIFSLIFYLKKKIFEWKFFFFKNNFYFCILMKNIKWILFNNLVQKKINYWKHSKYINIIQYNNINTLRI